MRVCTHLGPAPLPPHPREQAAAVAKPLAPPLPACGERSDSERSEPPGRSARGLVRGRSRESELVDKPPHPICFASQGLRSQIDLSPHAGRGGASGARVATSKQ